MTVVTNAITDIDTLHTKESNDREATIAKLMESVSSIGDLKWLRGKKKKVIGALEALSSKEDQQRMDAETYRAFTARQQAQKKYKKSCSRIGHWILTEEVIPEPLYLIPRNSEATQGSEQAEESFESGMEEAQSDAEQTESHTEEANEAPRHFVPYKRP